MPSQTACHLSAPACPPRPPTPHPPPPRSWTHPSARKMADSQCVLASGALAYDLFLGNASAGEQVANSSFYTRQPAVSKYGWVGASCLTAAAVVCEVEAGLYPCPPPPSPPAAPTPPDKLPPSGPTEGLCEWPCQASGMRAERNDLAAAGLRLYRWSAGKCTLLALAGAAPRR